MSETETLTLAGYLLARYDAEHDAAERAGRDQRVTWATAADTAASVAGADVGLFLLFQNPARVLADVAAKRAIVERCSAGDFGMPSTHLAHGILSHLAQPYADRDDFRPEWRA